MEPCEDPPRNHRGVFTIPTHSGGSLQMSKPTGWSGWTSLQKAHHTSREGLPTGASPFFLRLPSADRREDRQAIAFL